MPNYTPADTLQADHEKLLKLQQEKRLFVTVREAAERLGYTSTAAAVYKLNLLVKAGYVEKIRKHYRVIQFPAPTDPETEA